MEDGVVGDSLLAFGIMHISGGSFGNEFRVGGMLNITGGALGDSGEVSPGSTVNLAGGSIGNFFDTSSQSMVNIEGGSIGNRFSARGIVNLIGVSIGDQLTVIPGSTLNITGGVIGDELVAFPGGVVNLFVTEILLDGVRLGLALDETFVITRRGGALLEATLADGSFFDLTLLESLQSRMDFIASAAVLTVTRVAGPAVPAPGASAVLALAGLAVARRWR